MSTDRGTSVDESVEIVVRALGDAVEAARAAEDVALQNLAARLEAELLSLRTERWLEDHDPDEEARA